MLRDGLPSTVNEALLKPANYEIYVRDRSPLVHFTGKNYVLPRTGQEGIPVVSVNTRKIAVDIIRVGDRNLLPAVRSEDFLAQLSPYKIKQYIESDGKKIWSGTLDVNPELNAEVTTAFPVMEAAGKLDPGVYVMAAKPAGDEAIASATTMTAAALGRRNGSSSPISASPRSPARTAFMCFCARSQAPRRSPESRCACLRATMRF